MLLVPHGHYRREGHYVHKTANREVSRGKGMDTVLFVRIAIFFLKIQVLCLFLSIVF